VRQPRRLPRGLDPAEVAALVGSLRTWRDRGMAGLMLYSGLRSAEVLGLSVRDVDIGGRWVRVTGKGDKERRVPLDIEVAGVIQAYLLAERPASNPGARTSSHISAGCWRLKFRCQHCRRRAATITAGCRHPSAVQAQAPQPSPGQARQVPGQGWQPPQPGQYPAAGYPVAGPYPGQPMGQASGTSGWAVAAFIFGLLGGLLLGVIFGVVALSKIRRTGQKGRGLAIAGINPVGRVGGRHRHRGIA
jgi:hypothetical protein